VKVSIIVPVYNAEKYLEECLDSLLNQTLDDYELILVNDGSKDSSEEILREYAEKYPRKLKYITVENGGQGRARNIGIEMAQGEYLGFADSDDWVDPTMFEKLYNAAVECDADMSLCDCIECYSDGRTNYFSMTEYVHPMHITTSVWNKLFRSELAKTISFPHGLWYEDLTYVISFVLKARKIVPVHEGLYYYRIGQLSTMTNNNSRKNLDIIKILEGLKKDMLPEYKDDFETLVIRHILLDTVNRVAAQNSPDKKDVIKELLKYVHKHIPSLKSCKAYMDETSKRKLIMFLNYHGLDGLANGILTIKKRIR